MQNGIFKLDWGSFADALVMAAIFALATILYGVITTAGFNVFAADWTTIGENMVNAAFIAAGISLCQNILSTKTGSLLNLTPPTSTQA